jgi:hypothetical protein
MGFADKYLHALFSTDLRDDAFHHQTDALQAASLANEVARGIGSLLSRVKYADTLSRQFEDGNGNLAKLQREWLAIVTEKGEARKWIKTEDIPKIGHLAPMLYKRVADASLAHYLDGKCGECKGSGITAERRICVPCKGSGDATIIGLSAHETKLAIDMVSELMSLESSHSGAASTRLRREE